MASSRQGLVRTALRRGLRKRCPHCGEGPLFSGWAQRERCTVCGLVFTRNPGDTWAFTIIGDRLPIGAIVLVIYFGLVRSYPALGLTVLTVLAALVVWTAVAFGANAQQRTISMPPALTLTMQLVAAVLLGIMGLALATPLTAAGIVLVRELYVKSLLERDGGEDDTRRLNRRRAG